MACTFISVPASRPTGRANTITRSSSPTGARSSPNTAPWWTALSTRPTPPNWRSPNVIVIDKGDAGYLTDQEKADLETFVQARAAGSSSSTTRSAAPDPRVLRLARRWREETWRNQLHPRGRDSLHTIVDKDNPIMAGMTDFTLKEDESFYSMTWSTNSEINVLANAK